jgi:hypothetical protein
VLTVSMVSNVIELSHISWILTLSVVRNVNEWSNIVCFGILTVSTHCMKYK